MHVEFSLEADRIYIIALAHLANAFIECVILKYC